MNFPFSKLFSKSQLNEPTLPLDDLRWRELEGGYRNVLYDASVALRKLKEANTIEAVNDIYKQLWDELHHQGDVGLASYYAVPHLVEIAKTSQLIDYNVLALVTVIEIQRHKNNPKIPEALKPLYYKSIKDLEEIANVILKQDCNLELISSALAAIALAKNQIKLASAILNLDSEDVIDEFLENY